MAGGKVNEQIRSLYRRIVGVIKPQLREGSTVRALLMCLGAGASSKWAAPEYFPVVLACCFLIAAAIPDDLPW